MRNEFYRSLERNNYGFMLHNSSVGVAGRKESRKNHWIRQLFLDLILTQGRKFEDIKTNVTRNILETEPRRKCQELNCRNITKVKIDRNSIHFSNSRTQCNSGIIKGQTFEISSRISNTPITTFGKKNNNLNSNSFRSKNRDGV